MKMISFFCAILIASAFCCWGIVCIHTNVFGPMLSGTASLMFGSALFIYLFYDAFQTIRNAGRLYDPEEDRDL